MCAVCSILFTPFDPFEFVHFSCGMTSKQTERTEYIDFTHLAGKHGGREGDSDTEDEVKQDSVVK